jgi:hypothetical protein
MIKYLNFVLPVCLVLASACNSNSNKTTDANAAAEAPAENKIDLPPMPAAEIEDLRRRCTGIDYSFFSPGFSMSMYDRNEIMQEVSIIGTESPISNPSCQVAAMVFYKEGSEKLYDAELYFDNICTYLIFSKNGQRVYANALTESGKVQLKAIIDHMIEEFNKIQGQ